LVPPEQVHATIDYKPKHCKRCGAGLIGTDENPRRHQVLELPAVKAQVTEHRVHHLQCVCGAISGGELPWKIEASHFGPRLTALIAVLAGNYRLSQKSIQQLLSDVFGVEMALGSVSAQEQRISDAIAPAVQEAQEEVTQAAVVHADETGWREAKQKAWLWVLATTSLAVFVIRKSRGADVARELLSTFMGILVSDRWGAYAWVDAAKRQLCWSHLVRDFLGFADYGQEAKRLSRALLRNQRRMFRLWHRVRDGTLARREFDRLMRPVQRRICTLLDQGTRLPVRKIVGQCRRILKLQAALFTFVHTEGVLPTNNHAEQTIRHGVIWRKTSFGTDSENGSRFVERMLTVVMSLRLQKRNVLEWVTSAYQAKIDGTKTPSLLPILPDQAPASAA
jgi:transposase